MTIKRITLIALLFYFRYKNKLVLDAVVNGNNLAIPKGFKQDLLSMQNLLTLIQQGLQSKMN